MLGSAIDEIEATFDAADPFVQPIQPTVDPSVLDLHLPEMGFYGGCPELQIANVGLDTIHEARMRLSNSRIMFSNWSVIAHIQWQNT